jgi:cytidine deaminase
MKRLTNEEMIDDAIRLLYPRELALGNSAGSVACTLLSTSGKLYHGVCIDISSGIGFCAEHSAIAAMITSGETGIARVVAVVEGGMVLPPCGRCREFMYEIDTANMQQTEVILDKDHTVLLKELLPHPYHEVWGSPR